MVKIQISHNKEQETFFVFVGKKLSAEDIRFTEHARKYFYIYGSAILHPRCRIGIYT